MHLPTYLLVGDYHRGQPGDIHQQLGTELKRQTLSDDPVSPKQPPPWVGGWADRKLPENEKANNCLSTNKGLPRGEEHTAPKQDKSCNSDWVYYPLDRQNKDNCAGARCSTSPVAPRTRVTRSAKRRTIGEGTNLL